MTDPVDMYPLQRAHSEEDALRIGGYAMLGYCCHLMEQTQQDPSQLPRFQRFVYAMLHANEVYDPGDYHAFAQASWCYEQLGMVKEALWCCQRAVECGLAEFADYAKHLRARLSESREER